MLLISCAVLFVSLFERCFCLFFFERVSSNSASVWRFSLSYLCFSVLHLFACVLFFGGERICTPLEAWTLDMGGGVNSQSIKKKL